MQYRRSKAEGGTFFFTLVTHFRRPFLCAPQNIGILRVSFKKVKKAHPFTIDAIVILPDHIHCLWTLPAGDNDYSTRWRLIKSAFSRQCDPSCQGVVSAGRRKRGEKAVWQRRFWEHTIRDERDYRNHVEYIHYNPVKHGLVDAPCEWEFSSFMSFVQSGLYAKDWGRGKEVLLAETVGHE